MNNTIVTVEQQLRLLEKNVAKVYNASKKKIKQVSPIISIGGLPLIRPFTINLIQGKEGTHKSRLATAIASTIIGKRKTLDEKSERLPLTDESNFETHVLYVDTERNMQDELPSMMQTLNKLCGISPLDAYQYITVIPLLNISREYRLDVLQAYVEKKRETSKNHLLVILDVSTDCIDDFNSSTSANRIHDWMNKMRTDYNMTFLLVIHENPGGIEKARGHLGTELILKASAQIQIKRCNEDDEENEIFKISFKKLRFNKRYKPFFVRYDEKLQELILCSIEERQKASSKNDADSTFHTAIRDAFTIKDTYPLNELCAIIGKQLNGIFKERTIARKLSDLSKESSFMLTTNGGKKLEAVKKGREIFYVFNSVKTVEENERLNEGTIIL